MLHLGIKKNKQETHKQTTTKQTSTLLRDYFKNKTYQHAICHTAERT